MLHRYSVYLQFLFQDSESCDCVLALWKAAHTPTYSPEQGLGPASADFQSADNLFLRPLQAPSHVYVECDVLFCVCCDLDDILSIAEASFLCAARAYFQTVGPNRICPQLQRCVSGIRLPLTPPCLFKATQEVVLGPSPVTVRLKDHRHVQLVDIVARRGGRCFSSAVRGQLLSEGVQQLAEKVISKFCSLITLKEEKTLLKWILHCPQ